MKFDNDIIFVTMFYDLGKIEGNPKRRQLSEYIELSDLTLSVGKFLVIFTSKNNETMIRERMKTNEYMIIIKEYEELPYFGFEEIVKKNWEMKKPVFPEKLTYQYSLLMWCKLSFMKEVIYIFGDEKKYGWIDFGIKHFVSENVPNDVMIVGEKIKMLSVRYFNMSKIKNYDYHYLNILDNFIGAFFTGSAGNILIFQNEFDKHVKISIYRGYCSTDEPLFHMIYLQNPDIFELTYGDHKDILMNYNCARQGKDRVLCYLECAMSNKDMYRCRKICKYIHKGIQMYGFELNENEKRRFYELYKNIIKWNHKARKTK